ncbi:hypothetical protein [Acinetobacter sp. c1-l78]|uniref:hypothetical protein n=1 Tax=Acinetobacter sp. c1-l78 TaxID=3342803 RepID=UPI0035BA8EFF
MRDALTDAQDQAYYLDNDNFDDDSNNDIFSDAENSIENNQDVINNDHHQEPIATNFVQLFDDFKFHIENQTVNYSIPQQLSEISARIQTEVPSHQYMEFIQPYIDLLKQHNLDFYQDLIQPQQDVFQKYELEKTQNHIIDTEHDIPPQQLENKPISIEKPIGQDDIYQQTPDFQANQTEYHSIDITPTYLNIQENHDFEQTLSDFEQALQDNDYSDSNLNRFEKLLKDFSILDFSQQLQYRERIIDDIAWQHSYYASDDEFHPDFAPFIDVLLEHIYIEDMIGITSSEERILYLQQYYKKEIASAKSRMLYLQKYYQNRQLHLPEKLQTAYQDLSENKKFNLWGMLRLNAYFRNNDQERPLQGWEISQSENNINFQYLQIVHRFSDGYFWLGLVFTVLLTIPLYSQGIVADSGLSVVFSIFIGFVVFIFAIAPLLAKIISQHNDKVARINYYWLYFSFLLAGFASHYTSPLYQIGIYLWVVLSYIVLGLALHYRDGAINYFIAVGQAFNLERFVYYAGLIGLSLTLTAFNMLYDHDHFSTLALFLVPLVLLIYNQYFHFAIQTLVVIPAIPVIDEYEEPSSKFYIRAKYFPYVYAGLVTAICSMIAMIDFQKYFALFLLLLSSLTILFSSRFLSYLFKYILYLSLTVVFALVVPFLAFIMIVIIGYIGKQDYQEYLASKHHY